MFNYEKYKEIQGFIRKHQKIAKIVAISKNQPKESVIEALKHGVRIFGENRVQEAKTKYSGIIINAGAYTHTSVALLDALKIFDKRFIEVHMSNIYGRDHFRRKSYISLVADGSICGFGHLSYRIALNSITKMMGYSNN